MNEVLNKFLFEEDKFMREMHLRQCTLSELLRKTKNE